MKRSFWLLLSSFVILHSSFRAGATTPIKDIRLTGTATMPSGTLEIGSGASISLDAGSAIDLSLTNVTWPSSVVLLNSSPTFSHVNGLTLTTSTGTITIAAAKTLTVSNTLTLAGTDATTMTFPSASGNVLTDNSATRINGLALSGAGTATLNFASNSVINFAGGPISISAASGATLAIGAGGVLQSGAYNLTCANTITLVGANGTTMTFPSASGNVLTDNGSAAILYPTFTALTDGATVTLACASTRVAQNASVTLAGNRTLAITGAVNGMTGVLIVHQDATGTRTLALPAASKVIGGGSGAVILSPAANATDVLSWVYDGANFYWTVGQNFN